MEINENKLEDENGWKRIEGRELVETNRTMEENKGKILHGKIRDEVRRVDESLEGKERKVKEIKQGKERRSRGKGIENKGKINNTK